MYYQLENFFQVSYILEYDPLLLQSLMSRGGARNVSIEGLELPIGGLKWLKNSFFRTPFCRISSDRNPKFPPMGS